MNKLLNKYRAFRDSGWLFLIYILGFPIWVMLAIYVMHWISYGKGPQ